MLFRSESGFGAGRHRSIEGNLAGDVGGQPVGSADRGTTGAQDFQSGLYRAGIECGPGRIAEQDDDVFHAPALAAASLICNLLLHA